MSNLFLRLKQLLHESEGTLLALLVALHAIAVPSTFCFLIITASDWTWWNCLPRIAYFTFLAAALFLYLPAVLRFR